MSKEKEPTYEDLRRKYSDEEIAESFVFRSTMNDAEQAEADEEFREIRFELLKNMSDVGIHKTTLSRILNDREDPNVDLMYRLEQHSGKMIPATYWYKLHSRKQEEEIKRNDEKRTEAYKKVKNELKFKLTA